jgi:hypothetical protein
MTKVLRRSFHLLAQLRTEGSKEEVAPARAAGRGYMRGAVAAPMRKCERERARTDKVGVKGGGQAGGSERGRAEDVRTRSGPAPNMREGFGVAVARRARGCVRDASEGRWRLRGVRKAAAETRAKRGGGCEASAKRPPRPERSEGGRGEREGGAERGRAEDVRTRSGPAPNMRSGFGVVVARRPPRPERSEAVVARRPQGGRRDASEASRFCMGEGMAKRAGGVAGWRS